MTIKKTPEGYKVVSHTGKLLSRKDLTKEEAEQILRNIEYFKNNPQPSDKK